MDNSYSLSNTGVSARSIISYVKKSMKTEGFSKDEINEYLDEVYSCDYDYLLVISEEYLDKCNDIKLERDELDVVKSEDISERTILDEYREYNDE